MAWATASGLYLMGGNYSNKTSELVKEDGSVEQGFPLKYGTRQDKEDINNTGNSDQYLKLGVHP